MKKEPRPRIIPSITARVETGCGNLYVTVGLTKEGQPFEVFAILGKSGGCAACQSAALTKSISQGIRHGVPVEEYLKLLIGVRCPSPGIEVLSCPDAIGQVLKKVCEGEYKGR